MKNKELYTFIKTPVNMWQIFMKVPFGQEAEWTLKAVSML
jgi:hypothetical protein